MVDVNLEPEPYHRMSFLNANAKRREGAVREELPFLRGAVTGLPAGSPAIFATGDLQGRSDWGEAEETLLGCTVFAELAGIQEQAGLPDPFDCAALLAGDFYTLPNVARRGGTGDVSIVWEFAAEAFRDVYGVAGNHDLFSGGTSCRAYQGRAPHCCWDGTTAGCGRLVIGGVSGIPGSRDKPNRRPVDEFVEAVRTVLDSKPQILVLHAAPFIDDRNVGSRELAEGIRSSGFEGLLICGHVPWAGRMQRCGRCICLNVHEAAVTLVPDE